MPPRAPFRLPFTDIRVGHEELTVYHRLLVYGKIMHIEIIHARSNLGIIDSMVISPFPLIVRLHVLTAFINNVVDIILGG